MIGKTAVTRNFYNECCIEQTKDGQTVYTPIASFIAGVPDGAKISTNEQVQPMDLELFHANQEIVAADLDTFRNEIKALLNKKEV